MLAKQHLSISACKAAPRYLLGSGHFVLEYKVRDSQIPSDLTVTARARGERTRAPACSAADERARACQCGDGRRGGLEPARRSDGRARQPERGSQAWRGAAE